jgi:nitrite reductase/ring-hydroxylating ferredoxin subunit
VINPDIPKSDFEICSLDEIPDGTGKILQIPSDLEDISIIVLRSGNRCYAYVNHCPHFGMKLAESDSQLIFESNHWIKCNVHYAQFSWHNGLCLAGDCESESLQQVPIKIQNGMVLKAI